MNCNELDKRTKAYKECVKAIEVEVTEETGSPEVQLENTSELGDRVEKFLEDTGIAKAVKKVIGKKNCEGCQDRKEWLNDASLMRGMVQYDYMRPEEDLFVSNINVTGKMDVSDIEYLLNIYERVFQIRQNVCYSCPGTGKRIVRYIKQLRACQR